jgi:peptidoglycan/LPS O-acetylase OafA/YrhL
LPALWDWFALGLALAVLRARWEQGAGFGHRLHGLAARPAECWLLAAVVFTAGVPLQHGEVFLSAYGLGTHVAIGLAAALFILPAVNPGPRERRSRPMDFLTSRQMAWLGMVSYGIYLWHVPFRDLIDGWLGVPRGALALGLLFVLTLAGGIVLGALSWYLIERPTQAWARARERRQDLPVVPVRPEERLAVGDASTAVKASIPLS